MGRKPKHSTPVKHDTLLHKMISMDYLCNKSEENRATAVKILQELKEREAELRKDGKLTEIHLPHANGIAHTNIPDEFLKKIKENDFFKV